MPPSNNEDIQAVRITEAGSFERISLDRNKVLDSLYRAIGCRYVEVIQVTETISIGSTKRGSCVGRRRRRRRRRRRTFSLLSLLLNSGSGTR